jgi:hypothetical protein
MVVHWKRAYELTCLALGGFPCLGPGRTPSGSTGIRSILIGHVASLAALVVRTALWDLASRVDMDIEKMLVELRQERYGMDEAIAVLARVAAGQARRRGRPPACITAVNRRGRPLGSKNKPKE